MSRRENRSREERHKSRIRRGDPVMVIAGGNKDKRPNIGKVGKVLRFVGDRRDRVVVEGVNMVSRHVRQTTPGGPSGILKQEASVHVSNVMYYVETLKRPVRLKVKVTDDGEKVRGYLHPETREFQGIGS